MRKKSIPILRMLGMLLISSMLLIGCTSAPSPQPGTSSPPTETPQATVFVSILPTETPQATVFVSIPPTPETTAVFDSVLPTPTPSGDPDAIRLTPDPNWATLTGTLIGATNGEPVPSVLLFLERTPMERRVPGVLYGPPNDQPHATTNEAGQFLITKIPEGEYVLVIYSPPLDLQIAVDPSSGEPLFITAQVGSLVELDVVTAPSY